MKHLQLVEYKNRKWFWSFFNNEGIEVCRSEPMYISGKAAEKAFNDLHALMIKEIQCQKP